MFPYTFDKSRPGVAILENDFTGQPFTAKSFLAALRLDNEHWWSDHERKRETWVFRGHADSTWPLLPSAWRTGELQANEQFAAQLEKCIQHFSWSQMPPPYEFHATTAIEALALTEFGLLADSIGMDIPKSVPLHDSIIEECANVNPLTQMFPIAQIAQHHGVPTRLLDWTTNPLFAAYFAALACTKLSNTPDKISVWAMKRNYFGQPANPRCDSLRMKFYTPTSNFTPNIFAQRSVLSGFTDGVKEFVDVHKRWPEVEDSISDRPGEWDSPGPYLAELSISSSQASDLLVRLEREGINAATLAPSLDNVARTMMDRWARPDTRIFADWSI